MPMMMPSSQTGGLASALNPQTGGLLQRLLGQSAGGGIGQRLTDLLNPQVALPMAGALIAGRTPQAGFGDALTLGGFGLGKLNENRKTEADKQKTLTYLSKAHPELAQMVEMGMPLDDAWSEALKLDHPDAKGLMNAGDGNLYNQDTGEWITAPGAGGGDYLKRQQAAAQFGLKPDSPAYQTFVLTGKMPREDQQSLTAVDKKAILEADEMVSANENAIAALTQAEGISDKANSGYLAGTRATIANNLPDWMVPDRVSSPESSLATTDMDNAVVGQALASLKTIFGGNPTEGERSILLQLQGSSSMPKEVRKRVFARAKELAKRRLAFNKQRAEQLRGGTFYQDGGGTGGVDPAGGGWTVEEQ